MGASALDTVTTGSYNVAIGPDSLGAAATGVANNIMIGYNTGYGLTGDGNIGIGHTAFDASGDRDDCVAIGNGALTAATTGSHNVGIGTSALGSATDAHSNVAIGFLAASALVTCSPYQTRNNVAIGREALENQATQEDNIAIGYQALGTGNSPSNSQIVAIGTRAGGSAAHAAYGGTYVGYETGKSITSGVHNTIIGRTAGTLVNSGGLNTFVGAYAGNTTTTGTGNLAIGYAMYTSATGSVRGHIGYNNGDTGTADYAITFGRMGTDWSRLSYGASSFTTGSDERKKKDIADHPLGLSFINQLRTVNYHFRAPNDVPTDWDTYKEKVECFTCSGTDPDCPDCGGTNEVAADQPAIKTWQTGMLAQDVKSALDNLGVDAEKFNGWGVEDDGMQTLDYGQFVMPLIKALQEADDKIDALTARIETLEG